MSIAIRRILTLLSLIGIITIDAIPTGSIFAFYEHSLDELPSTQMELYGKSDRADFDDTILDLLPSVQQEKKEGLVFLRDKPRGVLIKLSSLERIRMSSGSLAKNNLTVELPVGVEIRSIDGNIVDPSRIGIAEVSREEGIKARRSMKLHQAEKARQWKKVTPRKRTFIEWMGDLITPAEAYAAEAPKYETDTSKTFEFGIVGQHLIFSKPVKITMDSDYANGSDVDVLVKHQGDLDYNTVGLTTDPNARCLADGSTDAPSSVVRVKNKKIEFYTCGASSYTMNAGGGAAGSNDLRFVIGDCGQFQLYYNGLANIYNTNPPATGCNTTDDAWIALRIGATTYGSDWTAWSTNTTTGSQVGNTYTGRTILTRVVTGRTYTVTLNWRYIAPNKFFNIDWSVNVPTGNTNNVRFYIANDSYVAGADANDVGYTGSTPSQTVGVYDSVANQMSAIRYLSGLMWTAQQANGWNTVQTQINNGADFTNAIQTTGGDLGFGVNWNFGTTAGTRTGALEWRLLPFVSGSVVDLLPGLGSPVPVPMQVGVDSTFPISITNAGTLTSSGVHTAVFSYSGTLIQGPLTPFTSNGWSCGAASGATVTCTKTTGIAYLGTETFYITVQPKPAASGLTTRFDLSISNPGDSNTSNNTAFSNLTIQVSPPPADSTPPIITSITPLTGSLWPTGNTVTMTYNYTDTGSQINQTTATGTLYKWNTGSLLWVAQTGAITPTSISSGATTFTSTGRTYGKYRLDVSIRDNQGNTRTGATTFYIDGLSWNLSTPVTDIGDTLTSISKFMTGEMIVTVQTVGAGFTVTMNDSGVLTSIGDSIAEWNGTKGYGYEKFNGVAYSGVISTINPWQNIQTQAASINTNGNLNTYTYRLKIGMLVDAAQSAGSYTGDLSFRIVANY